MDSQASFIRSEAAHRKAVQRLAVQAQAALIGLSIVNKDSSHSNNVNNNNNNNNNNRVNNNRVNNASNKVASEFLRAAQKVLSFLPPSCLEDVVEERFRTQKCGFCCCSSGRDAVGFNAESGIGKEHKGLKSFHKLQRFRKRQLRHEERAKLARMKEGDDTLNSASSHVSSSSDSSSSDDGGDGSTNLQPTSAPKWRIDVARGVIVDLHATARFCSPECAKASSKLGGSLDETPSYLRPKIISGLSAALAELAALMGRAVHQADCEPPLIELRAHAVTGSNNDGKMFSDVSASAGTAYSVAVSGGLPVGVIGDDVRIVDKRASDSNAPSSTAASSSISAMADSAPVSGSSVVTSAAPLSNSSEQSTVVRKKPSGALARRRRIAGGTNASALPTAGVLAENPTADVLSEKPTADVLAEKPTADVLAKKPTAKVLAEKLTAEVLAKKPTAEVLAKKPTAEVSAEKPTQLVPPTTIPDDVPILELQTFLNDENKLEGALIRHENKQQLEERSTRTQVLAPISGDSSLNSREIERSIVQLSEELTQVDVENDDSDDLMTAFYDADALLSPIQLSAFASLIMLIESSKTDATAALFGPCPCSPDVRLAASVAPHGMSEDILEAEFYDEDSDLRSLALLDTDVDSGRGQKVLENLSSVLTQVDIALNLGLPRSSLFASLSDVMRTMHFREAVPSLKPASWRALAAAIFIALGRTAKLDKERHALDKFTCKEDRAAAEIFGVLVDRVQTSDVRSWLNNHCDLALDQFECLVEAFLSGH